MPVYCYNRNELQGSIEIEINGDFEELSAILTAPISNMPNTYLNLTASATRKVGTTANWNATENYSIYKKCCSSLTTLTDITIVTEVDNNISTVPGTYKKCPNTKIEFFANGKRRIVV